MTGATPVRQRTEVPDVPRVAADLRLVIGRLARRLRGHGPSGLSPSQLSALANIDEHAPIRLSDLAAVEAVALPTTSRVVELLVQRGLVERRPDPTDGRGVLLALTPAGADALAQWRAARSALLADRLHRLGPADLDRLSAALPVLHALVDALADRDDAEEPVADATVVDR
jgi:DNA-binding MarR family transcriptional regulator